MMKKLIPLLLLPSLAYADDRAAAEKWFRAGAKAYAAQSFEVVPPTRNRPALLPESACGS